MSFNSESAVMESNLQPRLARASSNIISSGQSEVYAFNPCRDGRQAQPPAIATSSRHNRESKRHRRRYS